MRIGRRVALCISLVLTYAVVIPAIPASAAANDGTCEEGEICLWQDADFRACFIDVRAGWIGSGDWRQMKYDTCGTTSLNDSVTSYQNKTDAWFYMTEDTDFKGFGYCIGPRASGNVIPSFNDKASSGGSTSGPPPSEGQIRESCNFIDRD